MRLFQNCGAYRGYLTRLEAIAEAHVAFADKHHAVMADRNNASHYLKPVLDSSPDAFGVVCNAEPLQRAWALENGLTDRTPLSEILLAQIEHHRAEIFYNQEPVRYDSSFVRRLPGCVKKTVAWRAAPHSGADLGAYDLVVCNFPSILTTYEALGWRTAYFSPAHDPAMDHYADNTERPVDVVFVGSYTRHHRRRAELLQRIARMAGRHLIILHLDATGLTQKAESWWGRMVLPARYRRPAAIRALARPAVYGLDLYQALSQAKIVLNGAIDMAGEDRGNMRCFEAMGCGALLVSDAGVYPEGMEPGRSLLTYNDAEDASRVIEAALADSTSSVMAKRGHDTVADVYSKDRQWQDFQQLPL